MLENVIESLLNDQVGKIAEKNGIDPKLAKSIAGKVLPSIIGSIGANTKNTESATELLAAAGNHNEQSADDVDLNDGMKILGHLFGGNEEKIATQITNTTEGADNDSTNKIMASLAPLVLSYINQQQKEGNISADNISQKVEETSSIWDKDGIIMKIATSMLDENKDGSITDDLIKKGMQMFFGNKKNSA